MWLPNANTFRTKLLVATLAIGTVFSAGALVATNLVEQRDGRLERARSSLRASYDLRSSVEATFEEGYAFAIAGSDDERRLFLAAIDDAERHRGEILASQELAGEEAQMVPAIDRDAIVALAAALKDHPAPSSDAFRRYDATKHLLMERASALTQLLEARVPRVMDEARADHDRRVFALAFVALILTWACAAFFARKLTAPLVRLRDAVIALGRGEDVAIDVAASNEIGELARAFEAMRAEVRRGLAQIEDQRRRLADVFASMHEMVIVCDRERRVTSANASACAALGMSTSQLRGRSIASVFEIVSTTDASSGIVTAARLGHAREVRMRGRDGVELLVALSVTPLTGDDGVVFVAQDLTEQRRLEAELRQAQKLEAVGSLAAGIAHEINNPIQFIGDALHFIGESSRDLFDLLQHYREALASRSPSAAKEAAKREEAMNFAFVAKEFPDALANACDGIDRIATIVRSMREFAHPDAREDARIELNEVVSRALTIARNAYKYVAEIDLELCAVPPVLGRQGELDRVVLNLLVNAAHAIEEKAKGANERGRIAVKTRVVDGFVELSIADTGAGIPTAVRGRVFDPFFTTKAVGRGTGQGLSIARAIVDKYGGTITFETEVGAGTTFIVRLPPAPQLASTSRRPTLSTQAA